MIAASSLHGNSQRSDTIHRKALSGLCFISLAPSRTRVTQEKKMEYTHQSDEVLIYQSNFRAEDGATTGRSNAFYEGVVVPIASLFAVVLFVVGAMLLNH
jgi:hypothetical protein